MRRQRPNYARILGIGLGISLAVHVALIGLGRWHSDADVSRDGPLNVVTLPAPELTPEEAALAEAGAPSAGGFELSEPEVMSSGFDLAEHTIVLAEVSSSEINEPLVPRPRITPISVESGLTPIRVREPALVTLGDRGRQSSGGGGIGIGILVGAGRRGHGDNCAPSGINIRYPNRPMIGTQYPNRSITGQFLPAGRSQIRMPAGGSFRRR